jgi:hypothetical protein
MENEQDEIALEIGYISIHFASFDFVLNNLNTILINIKNTKIGDIISSELKTDSRIQLCKKLLKIIPLNKDLIDQTIENLSQFSKIKEERNKLIHGIIFVKDDDVIEARQFYISTFKTWHQNSDNKIEISALKKIKEELIELIPKQFKLNEKIFDNYKEIIEKNDKNAIAFLDILKSEIENNETT